MNYQTYPVDVSLEGIVKCFWSLEAPRQQNVERQRIVPDGCMEMIFHTGDLFQQFLPGGEIIWQPRSFVFGQITQPLEIAPSGVTGIMAARFEPDGFAPFLSLPLEQMENRAVPLVELFGEEGILIEQQVLQAQTYEERKQQMTTFLINRMRSSQYLNSFIRGCVDTLLKSQGQITVDTLAAQAGISRRQLERKFSGAIGLSPKQLSKMIRLQAAIKRIDQKQYENLTALAHESGYFDQAHFIKDFKEFSGISPRQFYRENLKWSVLFAGTE
jgi:AraC-like DNA-binding protein